MIDININKLNKSYGFGKILNSIDITVNEGDKIGLIGTNGCGKSTLLKIIAGKEEADSGTISIRNTAKIGYLSQIPEINDLIVKDYIYGAFNEIINLKNKISLL